MPMAPYTILAGKSYRTPDNEIREVISIEGDDVIYRCVAAPAGPGVIGMSGEKRMPLGTFLDDVESEVGGESAGTGP